MVEICGNHVLDQEDEPAARRSLPETRGQETAKQWCLFCQDIYQDRSVNECDYM